MKPPAEMTLPVEVAF